MTEDLQGGRWRDAIQRRSSTMDLIKEEGRSIQLHRAASFVPDGAGGFVVGNTDPSNPNANDPEPQDLFFTASLYEPLELSTGATGEGLHEKFILIGMPEADIEEGDWFTFSNKKYRVDFIHADRTYQLKAEGEAITDGS